MKFFLVFFLFFLSSKVLANEVDTVKLLKMNEVTTATNVIVNQPEVSVDKRRVQKGYSICTSPAKTYCRIYDEASKKELKVTFENFVKLDTGLDNITITHIIYDNIRGHLIIYFDYVLK